MKLYSFTTLILALLMNSGICTLEMLTQDSNGVTCTEGLDCEISFGLCVPGDEEEPYFPVLVPTRIRSWNMLRCNRSHGCFPCVQVELDMSVDFLPEKLEDRKGENCDEYISDYDMIYDVDDDEDKFILDENFYPEPESQINGSSLCANLFISHTVPSTLTVCEMIRVRIPLSSVPPNHGNHSIKVGKVLYSCINMPPSANLFLTAFTQPRYHSVLNKTHRVPDCKALSRIEEIKACQVPSLNISIANNVSVYVIGKQNQLYNLSLVYKQNRDHKKRNFYILKDKEVLHIPEADIVPCLCFQVFCINLKDAVRGSYCPLENYSQYIENVWRKSDLSLTVLNTILMYEFTAPCNMSVEVVLCLKSGQNSQCQALPHSRKKVFIKDPQQFKNVKRHPSLCVQVRIKDRILHTKCPHANLSKSTERNEVIVQISHHPHPNSTLCIMERDTCRAVYNVSGQVPRATEFLEKRVLKDFMTNKCIKVWSYSGVQEVYICPQDKYLRQRWSLAWVLCILVVSCILLFVILKRKEFEKCIKTMAGDHSLDEIFMDRKVLILYSPDNTEYEELVATLASSLKDLKLTVIFDQWHRIEMSKVNALPWYHAQKSAVLEEKGIVLLLFSEGARERFIKWDNSTTQQRGDPYGTFGAALNCIVPDFIKGITPRRYVVGYFDCQFKQDDVPKIFQVVPILSLPSQVAKLLTELAGPKRNKLSKKRLHKLSAKVSARLKGAMQKCQQNGHHSSFAQNSGSETSVSYSSNGSKPLELYSLI